MPGPRPAANPHHTLPPGLPRYAKTIADRAAIYARELLGGRYGNGTGPVRRDCSGLIVEVYRRVSRGEIELRHNTVWLREDLKPVRHYSQLRPGDVVFYYDSLEPSHCALYIGRTGTIGRRRYWVIQAGNERLGVECIGMNQYTPAVAYGRVRRGQRHA